MITDCSVASYRILQLVRSGKLQLQISIPVFEEYCYVLTRDVSLKELCKSRAELQPLLNFLAYIGEKHDIYYLLRPNLRDVLTIRVPYILKKRIEETAHNQGVSINQFAVYAFTKELGELENSTYYREYLGNKSKEEILTEFDEFMKTIPAQNVPEWDNSFRYGTEHPKDYTIFM